MKNKFFFTLFATALMSISAWAIGPQSLKVTFDGTDNAGWKVSSNGSILSTENGVMNVQMAHQTNSQYRADLQYETSGTYTFDKAKDVVWAVKLTGALPGSSNSRKFEINYKKEGVNTWINNINGPSGYISCADGGVIYYFDLAALNKLGDVPDGAQTINKIHFIFADAECATAEEARYGVDWVASFESVNDLKAFQDWNDEQTSASAPYFEVCFRPKTDDTGFDGGYPRNGFKDIEFEGNYQARLFAIEYFLVEDYSIEKEYTLTLSSSGTNNADMSVWDFPYQVTNYTSDSDINAKATAVVGIAPGSTSGEANAPIASSANANSKWTFIIPCAKLTPLATVGSKTLVGMLISSKTLTSSSSAKYASQANTTKTIPSFTKTGVAAIVNTTKQRVENTLAEAVNNADADDVLTLYKDVTVSGGRVEIKKALTIQGATGEEKLICGVAANTLMILANDETADYYVTFKDLVVDGQNTLRSTQIFDATNKGCFVFENVSVVNSNYSVVTGDVKSNNREVVLKGNNSFSTGIYLNKNKRVSNQNTTHTVAIPLILANDYTEDYAIVTTCDNAALYTAIGATGKAWELYMAQSGSKKELKGRIAAHSYDLTVSDAGMATLVLGFNVPTLPTGVKAYTLNNDGTADITATEESAIVANAPVLIIAEENTYTFESAVGAVLNEQANPTNGCLVGTYMDNTSIAVSASPNFNYILASDDAGVGFYQVLTSGYSVDKNHAYLSCGYDNSAAASAPMRIRFPQVPTQLDNAAETTPVEKVLIDGKLYIRKADRTYTIDGQLMK